MYKMYIQYTIYTKVQGIVMLKWGSVQKPHKETLESNDIIFSQGCRSLKNWNWMRSNALDFLLFSYIIIFSSLFLTFPFLSSPFLSFPFFSFLFFSFLFFSILFFSFQPGSAKVVSRNAKRMRRMSRYAKRTCTLSNPLTLEQYGWWRVGWHKSAEQQEDISVKLACTWHCAWLLGCQMRTVIDTSRISFPFFSFLCFLFAVFGSTM